MRSSELEAKKKFPIFFYPLSVVLGFAIVWILLEGFFWLMPVSNTVLRHEIDEAYHIRHFRPGSTIQRSAGWNFVDHTVKEANNLGFLSDHDFVRSVETKLMAIIGDSFVQAIQVKNSESHHQLLHAGLNGGGRVYGLGIAGSPLSNYLVFAEFARKELDPDSMSFVIVGNDFDESICQYFNRGTGMWCFTDSGNTESDLVPIDPPKSRLRELARYSALMRYLVFNLGINWRNFFNNSEKERSQQAKFVGNVLDEVSQERIAASRRAVDAFFARLPEKSGLPPEEIVFVVDAIRQDIYRGDVSGGSSFFGQMREYFIDIAQKDRYEVIDLQPVFADDYRRHGEKFEFPTDGHWNQLAHYIVASEIAKSNVFMRNFGEHVAIGARPQD